MGRFRFTRERLPIGDDGIPLLVARQDGEPKTVFMSYEAFLELAATLLTAVETLRAVGIEPHLLGPDDLDVPEPALEASPPLIELRQVHPA